MPMSTLGDLRQHFVTARHTTDLKTDLATLVEELTSGQASDLTAHLGTSQTQLAGLDRQLEMLGRFSQSNTETSQLLSTMQIALDNIGHHRETASSTLLTIDEASSLAQVEDAAQIARSGFEATVQSLNLRSGDRSMFGGNDLDSNPLAPSDDILNALTLSTVGLTEAADITAAIDDWFSAPGGGFETIGYQGDNTGFLERPIAAGQSVKIGIRADDEALRDTLKALATAAMAGDMDVTLTSETRKSLQTQAAEALLSVAAPLASVQSRLGYAEAQIEEGLALNSSQESSYGIARNSLVSADPFETAVRLQAVQVQLETHYTLTSRLSRLSLTEYLR